MGKANLHPNPNLFLSLTMQQETFSYFKGKHYIHHLSPSLSLKPYDPNPNPNPNPTLTLTLTLTRSEPQQPGHQSNVGVGK